MEVTTTDWTDLTDLTESPGFTLVEWEGGIFWCPSNMALVHCVSQDCHMSSGIVKEFQAWFPALRGLWCHKGKVGEAVWVEDGERLIFNLITKCRY